MDRPRQPATDAANIHKGVRAVGFDLVWRTVAGAIWARVRFERRLSVCHGAPIWNGAGLLTTAATAAVLTPTTTFLAAAHRAAARARARIGRIYRRRLRNW